MNCQRVVCICINDRRLSIANSRARALVNFTSGLRNFVSVMKLHFLVLRSGIANNAMTRSIGYPSYHAIAIAKIGLKISFIFYASSKST